jgi:glycine/serine hydroxymethyltransferase
MERVAEFIARALRERDNPDALSALRTEVAALCAEYPAYPAGAASRA